MTARQAALAAAGAGEKRKPAMDVDVSSDGEDLLERGRRKAKADRKSQQVDKKGKAAAGKAKPKKEGGRSKAQATEEDRQMEVKSPLEELPEALWMGEGLGALVGFVSCMESLSSVNSYFRSLTQQAIMHPILDLDASPTMNIAKKWTGRRLSECVSIVINHRPTPSLEPPTDKKGNDLPDYRALAAFERDNRKRKGNFSRIRLPHKKGPIVFEHLESASIRSVWVKIAEDREYQLPALKNLGLVNLDTRAPRQWIREGGIKSLHLISDEDDPSCSLEVRLDQVADFLKDTPSAKSLTSLTGRVSFHKQSQSELVAELHGLFVYTDEDSKVPDDAFMDHIATMMGPLDEIEMGLAEVQTSQYIQLLSADAVETYYHNLPPTPRSPAWRHNRRREANKTSTDLHLHMPFTGNGEVLADCLDTVQVCCRQANQVTLDARSGPGHVDPIPGLDSLLSRGGARTSMSVGRGNVLRALSPSLHEVRFELTARHEPAATCTLVPDGLGFMSSEGKELAVQLRWEFCPNSPGHSFEWDLCGDSEAGKALMESGRVSCLDVHIAGGLIASDARRMYTSFAECVVEAFSSFPVIKCVVLSAERKPLYARTFALVDVLRKAGKKRVRVTERTDGTVVLRPSQARRKAKREEGNIVVKKEEKEG
ncbi:unnamed protein product [Vitrella brassicaformis CCMP3155]|uniref:Uncharacterized protein n=1 Tax=Vitrella brassicaformis (strain CCMP3155) TaxID=1169540 RepID=A0A0G4EXX5_VITBC|nr:unnamed protein product [Vitrella brassicaformis CCMP3155]|eukprot:CEM03571.1 unnamed protein product [Vitrella brassicaformis CCMP3155]